MKKIVLLLSFVFISLTSWSQASHLHELKIDALGALIEPSLEVTYEYALNIHSGFGVASYFRLDPPKDEYQAFALAPFYRQYFYDNANYGNKGFFIEALLQYSTGKDEEKILDEVRETTSIDSYSDLGIGFGGGFKWITPNGFTLEVVGDLGRNFKLSSHSPDFFFRWGINLGYRFL